MYEYLLLPSGVDDVQLETILGSLADRTRLRILNLLGDQEVCVCFLVEILGESQPNISRHLAKLKEAGLIAARREGKWMHYRIADAKDLNLAKALRDIRSWLQMDPEMKKDRARLVKFCCGSILPRKLKRAPRPIPLRRLRETHTQ